MAILMSIETIIQEELTKFIILIDSLSTLKGIQNQFDGDIATKIQNNKLNIASEIGKIISII